MPRFNRVSDELNSSSAADRVALDERFLALFIPDTPLDRVESQELRQIVSRALQTLTPDELAVVEQRYQNKRSPGAVASRLQMDRDRVADLEQSALGKLRGPLVEYMDA